MTTTARTNCQYELAQHAHSGEHYVIRAEGCGVTHCSGPLTLADVASIEHNAAFMVDIIANEPMDNQDNAEWADAQINLGLLMYDGALWLAVEPSYPRFDVNA